MVIIFAASSLKLHFKTTQQTKSYIQPECLVVFWKKVVFSKYNENMLLKADLFQKYDTLTIIIWLFKDEFN